MTQVSVHERVGYRQHRVLGYVGRSGQPAIEASHGGRSLNAAFTAIGDAASHDSSPIVAFALVADGTPTISVARAENGSFMMLDGRLLEPSDTVDDLLQDWLTSGTIAFERRRFYGFIAAWNARTHTCVLLRDRFGEVPGFVLRTEHGLVYSTDIPTLLQFGADPTPDVEAIDAFLATGHFPSPMTPVASIRKIPPGRIMSFSEDGIREPETWERDVIPPPISPDEALDEMGVAFERALERSWPSDGNVGLLLSGGVDSALILAGAARMLERPIRSFTFRYEDYEGTLNEGDRARAVATYLGVPHEEISIRPSDVARDLDGAVAAYGEPFTWGIHSYRLGALVDRGITTVYSGAGADGASILRRYLVAMRFERLPAPIKPVLRGMIKAARPFNLSVQANAEWSTRSVSTIGEMYSPDSDWNRASRRQLYVDRSLADRGAERLTRVYDDAAAETGSGDRDHTLYIMTRHFLGADAVVYWNRVWSAAHGLELRLPYFDYDLYDLALSIEGSTSGKDVARKLAARYLTEEMAYAPKLPQQMPVNEWLRGPLLQTARERLNDLPDAMGDILDQREVSRLVEDHARGRGHHGWRLIELMTLASWFDQLPR